MTRKICFIALGASPLFTQDKNIPYIGGAELQQVLVGSELAKRNHKISFIIYDSEGENKKELTNITIIKSFPQTENISLLKKARKLWKSLKLAHPDIYIQAGGTPGLVAIYCFLKRKNYIKWVASDRAVQLKGVEDKTSIVTKISVYFDIKLAKLIVVQNEFQKEIITKKFKKKCILLKNPISIPNKPINYAIKRDKNIILWVGTIRPIKQPEIFLEIAQKLPEYHFKMIGGRSDTEPALCDKIAKKAEEIPNLEFLGIVPPDEILKHYEESLLFVNTSKSEGFPNTFLEAWINYTPVVSLNIDPDEIISQNKMGFHSKTVEQMIIDIKTLVSDTKLCKKQGENGRKYVEEKHDLNKIIIQFEKIIEGFEKPFIETSLCP